MVRPARAGAARVERLMRIASDTALTPTTPSCSGRWPRPRRPARPRVRARAAGHRDAQRVRRSKGAWSHRHLAPRLPVLQDATRCCRTARAWATATARWSSPASRWRCDDSPTLEIAVPGTHDDGVPRPAHGDRRLPLRGAVRPDPRRRAGGRRRRRPDHPRGAAHLRRRGPASWWSTSACGGWTRPACRCRWAATSSAATSATTLLRRLSASSRSASATAWTTAPRRWTTRCSSAAAWSRLADRFVGMYVNDLDARLRRRGPPRGRGAAPARGGAGRVRASGTR